MAMRSVQRSLRRLATERREKYDLEFELVRR